MQKLSKPVTVLWPINRTYYTPPFKIGPDSEKVLKDAPDAKIDFLGRSKERAWHVPVEVIGFEAGKTILILVVRRQTKVCLALRKAAWNECPKWRRTRHGYIAEIPSSRIPRSVKTRLNEHYLFNYLFWRQRFFSCGGEDYEPKPDGTSLC